jgi:hypothetical protein
MNERVTDTPRTDAAYDRIDQSGGDGYEMFDEMHEHARQLERELAEARAKIARLTAALGERET